MAGAERLELFAPPGLTVIEPGCGTLEFAAGIRSKRVWK
jgi:hypothetical protein